MFFLGWGQLMHFWSFQFLSAVKSFEQSLLSEKCYMNKDYYYYLIRIQEQEGRRHSEFNTPEINLQFLGNISKHSAQDLFVCFCFFTATDSVTVLMKKWQLCR